MRIILGLGLWLSVLPALAAAQSAECLPVRVGNPEGNYIVPGVQGKIVYRQVGGRGLALDAYVQKKGSRRPAALVIHGGGWHSGSRIAYVGQLLELLTQAGFNWFSVDYRLDPLSNIAAALDDLRAALAFIRCHADEFRLDPERIALVGEDAGAHLAALLAAERPAGVKAAVLIGGFYDLRELASLKATTEEEILVQVSPMRRIANGMPDTLVVHGTADREVPPAQAIRFCEAVRSLGGKCDYIAVDSASHRAENWWPQQWGYKQLVAAWLARQLGLPRPDHEPYVTQLKKEILYSPRHGLKLDAYIPRGEGPHPAVILVHGGGWEAGDKVTYLTPLFAPLAQAHFAWFSIDYRLTPQFRHPDQLEDLRMAIRFVRRNARRFKVDPQRIALVGESAGGQMVVQVATESPQGIAAAVSFYGVYDFEALAGARELTPRSLPVRLFAITELDQAAVLLLRRYSPLYNVHKAMPPLLLICGTGDSLWAQHLALLRQLDRVGARYEALALQDAPHGMENWEGHPEWLIYQQKLITWLRARLQ